MYTTKDVYYVNNFFTEQEVKCFCEKHSDDSWVDSQIVNDKQQIVYDPLVRKTKVKYLRFDVNDCFLTKFLCGVIKANEEKFKYTIESYLSEKLNLLRYESPSGVFKPHEDTLIDKKRSLTSLVMLSDEKDYEGGKLRLYSNSKLEQGFRLGTPKGSLIIFPSNMFHEVTAVTKGTRLSLVMWV